LREPPSNRPTRHNRKKIEIPKTAGVSRMQALCWGLICGFEVLLPYWYVCFFVPMIIHRAVRDDARCAEKYGKDWDTYIGRVPYVFVPGVV